MINPLKPVVYSFLFFLLPFQGLIAQQTELTLEDAILQQYGKFYPDRLSGLSWIPNSNSYYYYADGSTLKIVDAESFEEDELLLNDLNSALQKMNDEPLKRLPSLEFSGKEELIFSNGMNYYAYNLSDKSAEKLLTCDESGENIDYNSKSNRLAFTRDNNLYFADKDHEIKAITDNSDKNIVSGQAIARYEFGISKGTFWSHSGQKLAFYQKDESNVSGYPVINYTDRPASVSMVKYPMAGQKSEQARVGVYDFTSGKTTFLQVDGPAEQYLTNLAWSPDDKLIYLAVLNRGQDSLKLNTYNAETGGFVKTLFEEQHEKYVEPEHPPLFFEGLDDRFVWYSDRDGFTNLYLYNSNGKLVRQLTHADFDVKEVLGLDAKKRNLIYSRVDNLIDVQLYSVSVSSGKSKQLTEAEGVHHGYLSDTGEFLIESYSSVDVPNVVNLLSAAGKQVKQLLAAEDPLAGYNLGQMELPVIKAGDGTPLQGRLIKPVDFDSSKTYPVVVYVYGGPHAQLITNGFLASSSLWMFYLANQGYLVFTIDGRGSANRGMVFEQATFRNLGDMEIQDQLTGVEYLKSLPYVDETKMAVHGWSFGGFMTTSLMLRHPEVFQVGVAGGPVTDWSLYEVMYTERYMDTPEENPEGFNKSALAQYAGKLEGDLLLIHGLDDDVVVLQNNITLLDAFIKAGKNVDYFNYPGHKHNVTGKDRVHLYNKVIEYIKEKMPAE